MKGITFIGMSGAGKSAIGKRLAKQIGWKFLDLDDYILQTQGINHNEYMIKFGEQGLMDLEQKLTLDLDFTDTIFSPGGSIVYSKLALKKIKKETTIVYLEASLEEVVKHLGDRINRNGIIGLKKKGIQGLFEERVPLYEACANIKVWLKGSDLEEKVEKMHKILQTANVI